jgi:hypothetical protein
VSSEPRSISDYLVVDHARLHALLARATASADFDQEAFAEFRKRLLRHIAIEEKLLLPAARSARQGEPLARAHVLRVEHAALTSLLVPTPNAELCAEVLSILVPHDAMEEGQSGVYAECEQLFTAAESRALAAQAIAFREVKVTAHYDGVGVYRSAAAALAAAKRIKGGSPNVRR